MPSTQHDVKGKLMWAKVFESNRDRADFHSETDGAYKVTVTTDIVADVTGKAWSLDEKGFIGNGSEGIVKIEIYENKNSARKGARLLGLQVLEHVVYESEGGPSQPRSMFTDHSKSSGGSSSSTSSQEPQDSIPF